MSRILVGCCGFPVAQARYFREFSAVEIDSSFYQLPRLSTAERWRQQAPKDFVFTLKAWQLITHPHTSPTYRRLTEKIPASRLAHCGHFRDSPEVWQAWKRTRQVALALRARLVLLQTPTSFYPSPDHLRDLYGFFQRIDREGMLCVWEPRGQSWKPETVKRICSDLGLIHGTDPLYAPAVFGGIHYYRLHGTYREGHIIYEHLYSAAELDKVLAACRGKNSYVFFNNSSMFEDARRFRDLVLEYRGG